ncbi:uncharacterized protein LOC112268843 [Brachypodium distachyon]|uniref:uncharacterized protein LOC112268843 n=1 Tax=Brachypodium distachyon TaxID=15368 RepID=UPI000D0DC60D|nr:uncharacterized protein LOC112268843 [Brachypodium distachyon]|eukprot:XP_024310788.1 uncharacterized protein LOC112268843 [Brachypodium distachyon]
MNSLLSKLGALLAHEYSHPWHLRRHPVHQRRDGSMQAFLGDLSSTAPQGHDQRMKDWMKQICDITYGIKDWVDDFAHRLSHDPTTGSGSEICCAFHQSGVYKIWNLAAPLRHRVRRRRIRRCREPADKAWSLLAPRILSGWKEMDDELGKWVTIATALYQRFHDRFERRVMVTVSQSSDIEAIRPCLSRAEPSRSSRKWEKTEPYRTS